MKKNFNLLIAMVISIATFAQSHVERVLILNEGYFDFFTNEILVPVTLGAYNPQTNEYTVINTIEGARFASDLVVYENKYYVAADNQLLVYDIYTDELILQTEIAGIRKIAVSDEVVVVTRGEYLHSFDSYIVVLNRNTFEPIFNISNSDLAYTTEGVEIHEGKAYVAVNNGFVFGEEVGFIAIINLEEQIIEELIDLGPDGINPDNLMFDGEAFYTLNNKDFSGSSISTYRLTTGDMHTTNLLNVTSGCGTSAFFDGNVYYQDFLSTAVSRFDPVAENIIDETEFGNSFYGLAFDTINNLMYTSVTDFYSYGKIIIYDLEGNELQTFDAGVSPGNIGLDVRSTTGNIEANSIEVNISPNPATEFLHIKSQSAIQEILIYDITGRLIYNQHNINGNSVILSDISLTSGMHFVYIVSDAGTYAEQIAIIE